MASIDTARAIYQDEINGNEQSSEQLSRELEQRSQEIKRGAISDETREIVQATLGDGNLQDVADDLSEASDDITLSLGSSDPIMKQLPSNTAAQAELESDNMWVDPDAIQDDSTGRIIDVAKAQDFKDHEHEHNLQSKNADQEGIQLGNNHMDSEKVREAAAISVQKRTDFLSTSYKQIMNDLPMDEADRELVRKGEFQALEKKKAGVDFAQSA